MTTTETTTPYTWTITFAATVDPEIVADGFNPTDSDRDREAVEMLRHVVTNHDFWGSGGIDLQIVRTDSPSLERIMLEQGYDDKTIVAALEKASPRERWPEWVPDLEALGVIAYVSTPDAVIDPDVFPGRVAELGRHEDGWSLGLMLRSIYETANEATRQVIDGDSLGFTPHIWELMTGEVVEL